MDIIIGKTGLSTEQFWDVLVEQYHDDDSITMMYAYLGRSLSLKNVGVTCEKKFKSIVKRLKTNDTTAIKDLKTVFKTYLLFEV